MNIGDVEKGIDRIEVKSAARAQTLRERPVWWLIIAMLLTPLWFVVWYVAGGAWLRGAAGFISTLLHAYENFLAYAKAWELRRGV